MKKIFYIALILLVLFLLRAVFLIGDCVNPYKETIDLGQSVVAEMKLPNYKLASAGWIGEASRNRVSYLINVDKSFTPIEGYDYFLKSLKLIQDKLNNSPCLLKENGGEAFLPSNVSYAIHWNDALSVETRTKEVWLMTYWSNKVLVEHISGDMHKIRSSIPYEIFKQLVEEKRFDEILHYGK